MVQQIIKIGNSKGIRIPAPFLKQLHIEDEVDMKVENGCLIIFPIKDRPRKGWKESIEKEGPDELLLPDVGLTTWEDEEWTW